MRPNSPPSGAVRQTRRALRDADPLEQITLEPTPASEPATQSSASPTRGVGSAKTVKFGTTSPAILPKSQAKQVLAKEKLGMRSTSNKENMQPMSPATHPVAVPQANVASDGVLADAPGGDDVFSDNISQVAQSPVEMTAPTIEDPIEAMDALEDAIEEVDKSLPQVGALPSLQKSQRRVSGRTSIAPSSAAKKPSQRQSIYRQSIQPSSLTRTSSTRKSLATRPSAMSTPAAGSKRDPSTKASLARSSSIKPRPSTVKVASTDQKTDVKIPHSKPRPISLSFPTPPPPAKSRRPATKSTFALPGEAVAAKLKVAKEERLKREAEKEQKAQKEKENKMSEENKRPTFKARPAPNFAKQQSNAIVRQTTASTLRQSLMSGSDAKAGPATGLKRASSVRESGMSRPSTNAQKAATRLSTVPRTFSASTTKAPTSALEKSKSQSSVSTQDKLSVAKRTSVLANSSKPRISIAGQQQQRSTSGTKKGKEVFQRAAIEKEELERKKREKEDAAKKARAEASERGRLASREWAQKQKVKKSGGAGGEKKEGDQAVAA